MNFYLGRMALILILLVIVSGCAGNKMISEGIANMEKDDINAALTAFDKSVKAHPEEAEAYYYRARAHSENWDYDAALDDYNRAIKLDPDYADAYMGRAEIWRHKEKKNKCIADLSRIIEIDENRYKAYSLRGDIYKEQGKTEKALADFNTAISLAPETAYKALYHRGLIYKKRGDLYRAWDDFNRVVNIDPNFLEGYIERAEIKLEKKYYKQVIRDCTLILGNFASAIHDSEIYKMRAKALMERGRIVEACADFRKACEGNGGGCDEEDFAEWREKHCN